MDEPLFGRRMGLRCWRSKQLCRESNVNMTRQVNEFCKSGSNWRTHAKAHAKVLRMAAMCKLISE